MVPDAWQPPVLQHTTVKDQPLQLDRLPAGEPCRLNYRQEQPAFAVRRRVWLRVLVQAVLVKILVGVLLVVVTGSPAASLAALVTLVAAGLAGLYVLAARVLAVATRWLTAAPQIDPATLARWRGIWTVTNICQHFTGRAQNADAGSPVERRPLAAFSDSVSSHHFGVLTTASLGIAYCLLVPLSPLYAYLAVAAVAVGFALRSARAHGMTAAKLWFHLKLAVVPLAEPPPPWVSVPAPGAATNARLLKAVLGLGFALLELLRALSDSADAHYLLKSWMTSLLLFWAVGIAVSLSSLALLVIPSLKALEDALDPVRGTEAHPDWTPLDGYSERLRQSPNPLERDCLLFGAHPTKDFPYLLQGKLLTEHLNIIGPPGTGKTSIGLASLLTQVIRRGDGAVVVIDCKGDPLLFHTVKQEAEAQGRSFKWFTNIPDRSTYIFNPFDRTTYDKLTMQNAVGLLVNSLNLSHGSDYGRAWFSTASRILLKRAYEHAYPNPAAPSKRGARRRPPTAVNPIESFADLNAAIQYLMKSKDGKQYEAARHLSFVVEQLAEYEALNLAPNRATGETPPALANAISMPHVLANNEVVYFYLGGLVDSAAVGELGRLALFSLLTACQQRFDSGAPTRAYCVIDEAQTVVAQNISNVLAKARSYGLSLTLAHQSMSQLFPPGGTDLRELVTQCTATKQIFACRDPWLVKHVGTMSGQVRYANLSYETTTDALLDGRFGIPAVLPDKDGHRRVKVVESVGDRLTPQDIQEIGFDPSRCILAFEQAYGLTQYLGYFPGRVEWTMEKAEAERRAALPWPTASADTITVVPHWPSWPAGNAHTITPQPTPAGSHAARANAAERLDRLKSLLDLDGEG